MVEVFLRLWLDKSGFEEEQFMKKTIAMLLVTVLMLAAFPVCKGENLQILRGPVIGIAWRSDTDSEFFTNICRAIESAGGEWVLLSQVQSADLEYDGEGHLIQGVTALGSLDEASAKYVRVNTWHDSNAAEAVGNVGIVLFTGGEDISPSLYFSPEPWHGIVEEIDFCAERDVSDYLLMSYCLENDIAILAICRGMEMLSIVSGAEMIQDIPDYLESLGLKSQSEHRIEPESPGAYPGLAFHNVIITDRDCLLFRAVGKQTIENVPSWHHQAVRSVEGTRLKVTGITETAGIDLIEAVERPDKSFVLGLQFHPEIAVVRELDDDSLCYFEAVVAAAKHAQ